MDARERINLENILRCIEWRIQIDWNDWYKMAGNEYEEEEDDDGAES